MTNNKTKTNHICCICGETYENYGNNPDGFLVPNWLNDFGGIKTGFGAIRFCDPVTIDGKHYGRVNWEEEDRCCDSCNEGVLFSRMLDSRATK